MEFVLLVVQMIIALLLIGVVLIQRSESDGMGFSGASGGAGLISSRGQSNLLTRSTAILAALFMINSLVLTILTTEGTASNLIDEVAEENAIKVPLDGAQSSQPAADGNVSEKTSAPETAQPETQSPDNENATPAIENENNLQENPVSSSEDTTSGNDKDADKATEDAPSSTGTPVNDKPAETTGSTDDTSSSSPQVQEEVAGEKPVKAPKAE